MELEGFWTRVIELEHPDSPIYCATVLKPSRMPTVEEEANVRDYGCLIEEENPAIEDDDGTP